MGAGTLAGVQPQHIVALARRIASGQLRGDAAFDAVVSLIAAEEIPPGATQQQAAQVRDQVALGVSHDRELCALIYRQPDAPRAELAGGAAAPAGARRVDRAPPARTAPPPKTTAAPGPTQQVRRTRRAPEPELELLDDARFAARQRRQRILSGLAVIVVLAVVGFGFWLVRPSPCETLATNTCGQLLSLGQCEVTGIQAELEAHGADAALCEETIAAVQEATADLAGDRRTKVYVQTLKDTLGFDPLNLPEPEPEPERADSKPVPLVTEQASMTSLFLDEAHLYWSATSPPGVYRVRSVGGTAQPLANHPGSRDVWVSDDFVYWLSVAADTSTLWADKKRGEHDPQSITVPETHRPMMAAFMGPHAAYVDGPTNAIYVIAVAGGEPRELAPASEMPPMHLVGDGEVVMWTTPGPAAQLRSAGVQEGPATTLSAELGQPRALTLAEGFVYWADDAKGSIHRMPKAGGEVQTVAGDIRGVSDIEVGRSTVYWVESAGTLKAAPLPGTPGEARTIASGLAAPRFVVADAAAVFWESGGTVFRLPQ